MKTNGHSNSNGNRFDETAVVVLLSEVADVFGGSYESVGYWIRTLNVKVVEDWAGRSALRVGDARRVLQARNADKEAHDAKWEAYQKFLADRREEAHRQRVEEITRQHEEVRKARTLAAADRAARALREKEAEIAAAAAKEAERRPSFETWQAANP